MKTMTPDRFWKRLDKESVPGCWLWRGWRHKKTGYGYFSMNGHRMEAHRAAWILTNGPIPDGMFVGHICDVRACVNPEHLHLVTPSENQRERSAHGRAGKFRRSTDRHPNIKPWTRKDEFFSFIEKRDTCWIWQGGIDTMGYGRFRAYGEYLAHRVSFLIHNGYIDPALDILHSCDNPACVNPDHLKLGTHRENMQDMISKGRRPPMQGEKHPMVKLSDMDIVKIRHCYAMGGISQKQLGIEYGVSQTAISYIVRRKGWTHIP